MSNELRVYRFAPDQPGRGGQTSGFHSFLKLEDTRIVSGFRPYRRMWKKDPRWTRPFLNNYTPRQILGFADWFFYASGATAPTNRQVFADGYFDTGSSSWVIGMRWLTAGAGPDLYFDASLSGALWPATILPVKDRLFMSTGLERGRIWDGKETAGTPSTCFRIGVPSPERGPTLAVDFNFTSGRQYYCAAGAYSVQFPTTTTDANTDGLVENETVRLTHQTLSNPDYRERKVVERVSGKTYAASPTRGPFPLTADTTPLTIDNAVGTNTWTLPNCGLPADADGVAQGFIGLTLVCGADTVVIDWAVNNGDGSSTITSSTNSAAAHVSAGFRIEGVRVTLDGQVPGQSKPTDATPTDRKLSRPAPGTGYTSWTGPEAPGYAYAYLDPVTGHISNLSPVTYLDSLDVINGRVKIALDPYVYCADGAPLDPWNSVAFGGLQYVSDPGSSPAQKYSNRFTKIVFFRTRRSGGGAVLYPLGSLDPTSDDWYGIDGACPSSVTGATWTDEYGDEKLLVSGRIRAPLLTNFPPRYISPAGVPSHIFPRGMAWWDGRLWLYGFPDMGGLRFSCDAAQTGMGRPEESFPDGNRLVVPAGDGEITALLVVGEFLLVNTRRNTYVVQGNHESNYRLVRVATELGGADCRRLCEIPSGAEGGGSFAAVTGDQRVVIGSVGGALEDIGAAVRDKLGGPVYGIAFYRADGHPRLAIACDSRTVGGLATHSFLEFNFDHKTWTLNGPSAVEVSDNPLMVEYLTAVHRATQEAWPGSQTEPFLVAGAGGSIFMQPGSPYAVLNASLTTWPIPADAPKRRYAFVWARAVYASEGDLSTVAAPTLTVVSNDKAAAAWTYAMAAHSDPARQFFGATTGVDGYVKEWVCFGPAGTEPTGINDGTVPVGYRLMFTFAPAAQYLPLNLVFLEVAIREFTTDGELEP